MEGMHIFNSNRYWQTTYMLSGKILKTFPWHWESLSFNILLVFSDSVEREENNTKSMKIGKKEIKPSSITGDIIMCV